MDTWKVEDSLDSDVEGIDRVIVRIVAGDVSITKGEQADFSVRRESGAEVHVEVRDGTLRIAQPAPDLAPLERFFRMLSEGRRNRCTVAVTAPAGAKIDVSAVSASVVVSGFEGGTHVKTVSGDVTLSDLQTVVDVKTVSGDVAAKHIAAELKAKTVSGDVSLVDGACRYVDAKTVSGEVVLDLDLDPAGTYDATTVSGNVSLRMKTEPNLAIDAKTVSGSFVSDFGEGWTGGPGKRTFQTTIGDGGARLWVKTVSGDLRLLRSREAAA